VEEEPLGVFRRILAVRSKDEKILENAQDGGVVSTILKHLFEQKSIDGAIVAAMKEGFWEPFPRVTKNFDDVIIASARTKFGISPNLMLIRDAVLEEYLDSICIGLPIWLFCGENYEYLPLRKYVEGVLGEGSIAEVRKFSVFLWVATALQRDSQRS